MRKDQRIAWDICERILPGQALAILLAVMPSAVIACSRRINRGNLKLQGIHLNALHTMIAGLARFSRHPNQRFGRAYATHMLQLVVNVYKHALAGATVSNLFGPTKESPIYAT